MGGLIFLVVIVMVIFVVLAHISRISRDASEQNKQDEQDNVDGQSLKVEPIQRGSFSNRFKTKYLWVLFVLWIAYGQIAAYLIAERYIYDFLFQTWDAAFRFVPAILRLKDVYPFGVDLARLQATAMLISTPALFILMLAASVEDTIHGVRVKRKESLAVSVIVFVVLLVLISGFSPSARYGLFRSSYAGYSVFIALMTYFISYFLRTAFCLVFKR